MMVVSVSCYHLLQFETSIVLDPPKMEVEGGIHVQCVLNDTDYNVSTLDSHKMFDCFK